MRISINSASINYLKPVIASMREQLALKISVIESVLYGAVKIEEIPSSYFQNFADSSFSIMKSLGIMNRVEAFKVTEPEEMTEVKESKQEAETNCTIEDISDTRSSSCKFG